MSDPEEILQKFEDEVVAELEDLQTSVVPGPKESDPMRSPEQQEKVRLNRMIRVCAKSVMAVEKSIKNLAALHSELKPNDRARLAAGRNISACLSLLPPGLSSEISDGLKALNIDFETMSSWRVWAGYPDNLLALGPLADDLAFNCVAAAVEFSGMLCSDLHAAIGSDNEVGAGWFGWLWLR